MFSLSLSFFHNISPVLYLSPSMLFAFCVVTITFTVTFTVTITVTATVTFNFFGFGWFQCFLWFWSVTVASKSVLTKILKESRNDKASYWRWFLWGRFLTIKDDNCHNKCNGNGYSTGHGNVTLTTWNGVSKFLMSHHLVKHRSWLILQVIERNVIVSVTVTWNLYRYGERMSARYRNCECGFYQDPVFKSDTSDTTLTLPHSLKLPWSFLVTIKCG